MTAVASKPEAASPSQGDALDLRAIPEQERRVILDRAFDYRGDVTLGMADGTSIECFVFDRREGRTLADSVVRVMLPTDGGKRSVSYDAIVRVEFSGKDTAAGKTWENWVRRYVEKRLAGERASIEDDAGA